MKPIVWNLIAFVSVSFTLRQTVYAIALGGVVYNTHHNVPLFKLDRGEGGAIIISEYIQRN